MLFFFTRENIEVIKKLQLELPNDMEFGTKVRSLFWNEKFVLDLPNDQELGKTLRRLIKNL